MRSKAGLIKPPRLCPGDLVGIAAPASPPPDPAALDACVAAVEAMGFKPRLGRHARKRLGFLAGSDRERAADLMAFFTDRKVKGILCVRGGYGTARLLPRLDFHAIRQNPKVFVGYSDITSLHCAFLAKSGLVSFHGPMLNSDFIQDPPAYTREAFLRVVSGAAAGSIRTGCKKAKPMTLRGGKASGRLIGGNLTLLCSTLGTAAQPSFRDAILFFEDLGEEPYRFDRMLTQLLLAGLLSQVSGVAIGTNKDCFDPKAKTCREYRQTVEDVFRERLLPLKVPVVAGLPFGHVPLNATLPIGIRATLDGTQADLVLEEPAVT